MTLAIIIGLAVLAVLVYYYSSKKDVPSDIVSTDQGGAPYKVETPVPAADVAPQPVPVEGAGAVDVAPIVTEVVETGKVLDKPKRKPAARTAAPKKTAAKKTAGAKKPAAKKKSA